MGALIVECNGRIVNVGTGFSDGERQWFWDNRLSIIGEQVRVAFHDRHGQNFTGPRYLGPSSDSEISLLQMCDTGEIEKYRIINSSKGR